MADKIIVLQDDGTQKAAVVLGTAASKDIPASGDAGATQVVIGNDTRLADARTPTSHTHAESDVTNLATDLAAKAPLASPTFTGTPAAPTAAADTNTTQLATTAFVVGQAGTATPLVEGTAAVGTSKKFAREDHVHPVLTTQSINAQTGTTYTFVAGDAGKLVTFGSSSATTVTVPKNDSVAFAVGTKIDCVQVGAGKVTFSSDATINSKSSNKSINGQYVAVTLLKTDTDTWLLIGDLQA